MEPDGTVQDQLQRAEAAYERGDHAGAARTFEAAGREAGFTPRQLMMFGHALTEAGQPERAEGMLNALMHKAGRSATALLVTAQAAAKQEAHGRALTLAAAAERLQPELAAAPEMMFQLLLHLGAPREAIAALHRAAAAQNPVSFATVNDLCAVAGLTGQAQEIPRLAAALGALQAAPGRPQLFVGMPKSGGATIAGSIANRLGCAFAGLGADLPDWAGFPAPWLHPDLVDRLAATRIVLLSHAAAIDCNAATLARFEAPVLVHMRDPRDALVSLFEMAEAPGGLQLLRFLWLQPDYVLLSRQERLAVLQRRVYPLYLRWIESWLRRARELEGAIRFSTYEAFLEDPAGLVDELAQACGAAPSAASAVTSMHFRQGRAGSHRHVFDTVTSRRMFEAIPAEARARFGWQA